jgi:hypothetical protein
MFNLQINNENVELSDKTKLQLHMLVLNASDISQRGITISNALTLPFSKKNDRLTGYPSRLNSNNLSFETNSKFILLDQNRIISTGNVIIKSFDEKTGIKIQLAEGYNFWSYINSNRLFDLDLNSFDVTFSAANFTALSNKTTSPFLWGLSASHSDISENALQDLVYSRPSYRMRILLDQIISQAGYTVDYTNLFTQTKIDDLGFISNARDFSVTDYKRSWSNSAIASGDISQSSGSLDFSLAGNALLSGNNLINQLYATSYVIKGEITAVRSCVITITYVIGSETLIEAIPINKGVNKINYKTESVNVGGSTVFNVSDDVTFNNVRIYSHINESDIVEIVGNWGVGTSILDGFQMLTDYNLPSMTQGQLFKAMISHLFLKVDIDELKKEIVITSFKDVLSQNNSIDLSGKLEKYPSFSSGNSYARINTMSFNNDESISSELGTQYFTILNENAKPSKSFVNISEFSASNDVYYDDLTNQNTMIHTPIYTNDSRESILDRIFEFVDGDGITYSCVFGGIGFKHNEYTSFIESTKRERTANANVLLNSSDYKKIKSKPVVYFSDIESYFLILKISGFEVGDFTKVQMIKYG